PPAEVFLGERRLGASGEALAVPRGEQPIKLTLRAEGYRPHDVELRPNADREVSASLVKKTAAPAPAPSAAAPSAAPKARPRVSSDLENPFD
ncbi:MAG TPA: hypothetical protein VFS00_06165, partial [Polyangiaceae bacterium]|nr:hypothetical protein [Polyangiaceae bacterium]